MGEVKRFAIVTTTVPKSKKPSYYKPSYAYRKMAKESQGLGVTAVIVHPDQFHWKSRKMIGWVGENIGTANEKWNQQTLPLPHVVYDNVFVHLAIKGRTNEIRNMCRQLKIPIVNPFFPGKLTVNQVMEKYAAFKKYLPVTKRLNRTQDLYSMLEQFETVYVKPLGGYGGQGVTRIQKEPGALYKLRTDRPAKSKVKIERKLNSKQLNDWLKRNTRSSRLIVQQGLNLLKVNGGQVDFRVVVQRGKTGNWKLIGIVPKIAAPGGVVTNLIAGGRKTTLEWFRNWSLINGVNIPFDELESSAVEIATFWSNRYPTLGILGMDVGIDKRGNIWLIEINSKPARSLLSKEMLTRSYQATAEFGHYLSEIKQNRK